MPSATAVFVFERTISSSPTYDPVCTPMISSGRTLWFDNRYLDQNLWGPLTPTYTTGLHKVCRNTDILPSSPHGGVSYFRASVHSAATLANSLPASTENRPPPFHTPITVKAQLSPSGTAKSLENMLSNQVAGTKESAPTTFPAMRQWAVTQIYLRAPAPATMQAHKSSKRTSRDRPAYFRTSLRDDVMCTISLT